jgi:hypothetical protein
MSISSINVKLTSALIVERDFAASNIRALVFHWKFKQVVPALPAPEMLTSAS